MNIDFATQAWLAKLPAPERAAAAADTHLRLLLWIGAGAVVTLAAFALSRAGMLPALRRRIEAEKPRPWLTSATLAAVVALTLSTAMALYDALAVAAQAQGVAVGPHLAAGLLGGLRLVLPGVGLAVLVAAPLLALARWRPRAWPWIAGAAFAVLCLGVMWGPYAAGSAQGLAPAPPGPVRDGLLRLAADAGVPAGQVHLSPDPGFDADVTGAFGRATLVVGRETLAWPAAEARAEVGHLMGHWAHGDMLVLYLIWGLSGWAGLLAWAAWGAPLARALGAREVTKPSDPEALPAAAVILLAAVAICTLTMNGYMRWANVRADAYSLEHAREPDGLAAVIEREWDHKSVDPSPPERWALYSHPPLAERLRHAMAWKAARGG